MSSEELDADAYPVVAAVINTAHRAYEAWRDWMEAPDAATAQDKAFAHGHAMRELCNALAEVYKVIPLRGEADEAP